MLEKLKTFLKKFGTGGNGGFTLIEVVIVLAIAGLIFVIVFLAVGQAQASRRDTQRRNDANRFIAAVSQWSSNKNGTVPTTQAHVDDVKNNYVNDFSDPSTGTYVVTYSTTSPSAVGNMSFSSGRVCNATNDGLSTGGARNYALLHFLERGGVTCVDSE